MIVKPNYMLMIWLCLMCFVLSIRLLQKMSIAPWLFLSDGFPYRGKSWTFVHSVVTFPLLTLMEINLHLWNYKICNCISALIVTCLLQFSYSCPGNHLQSSSEAKINVKSIFVSIWLFLKSSSRTLSFINSRWIYAGKREVRRICPFIVSTSALFNQGIRRLKPL